MLIGVLGVVAAIVILVVVLVRRSRARTAAAYAAARLMVVDPDPALRDLIFSLWTQRPPSPNVKLELLSLHRSEETSDEVYSVFVRSRERHPFVRQGRITIREGRGTLMRSSRLRGPALELIERPSAAAAAAGAGKLVVAAAQMGDDAAEQVLSQFGPPVAFADDPEFSARYLVAAPDVDAARAYLTPERRRVLVTLEGTQLSSRPGFALVQRPTGEILERGEPLEVRLRTDLDTARKVLTALSS
jgi:hypothetical protein